MTSPSSRPSGENGTTRRQPSQQRSKERVARILDASSTLIVSDGVAALTTRKIADHAQVPVASIYQYFADKEEILLELVKRDTAEMDAHVAASVAELETLSIRSIVTATVRAFIEVYARRREFVAIYFHGRTNAAVMEFCREHNRQIARSLYDVMFSVGLLTTEADVARGELAIEVGDAAFQLAFREDFTGDQRVIDDCIEIVVGYLERFATPAGRTGVPAPRRAAGPR